MVLNLGARPISAGGDDLEPRGPIPRDAVEVLPSLPMMLGSSAAPFDADRNPRSSRRIVRGRAAATRCLRVEGAVRRRKLSLDDAQTTRDAEPIVRIHFPPAASLRTVGPSGRDL